MTNDWKKTLILQPNNQNDYDEEDCDIVDDGDGSDDGRCPDG